MHKFFMAMGLSLLAVTGLSGCGGEEETKSCEQTCQESGQSAYSSCLANGGEEAACLQQGEAAYQQCSADCAAGGNNGGGNNGGGNNGGGNNGGGNNGGAGGSGGNGGGNNGGGGGEGGMMFDPPGSTLPPEVAGCERGCLQAILCDSTAACPFATAATVINRCRSVCADAGQRAAFTPLEMQSCPGAGTSALDALGLSGTCLGADNLCVAAMMPCEVGNECVGGACQPFQCAPDMNEGLGMGPAAAVDLGGGDTTVLGMSLCSGVGEMGEMVGDEDWYRITVAGGTNAFVELAFENNIGDVDIRAYLESDTETFIENSSGTSDNERMVIRPAETDRVILIRVFGFTGAQNNYDLYITHDVPLSTCSDSGDCEAGYGCQRSLCVALPPCMIDDDCGFSGVCEVATGICRSCLDDGACGEGRYCVDYECVACRDNADCEAGLCFENSCVECIQDSDCPNGTCGDNNICRAAACDDPYEPNDEGELAAAIPLDQDSQNAYACGDDDFYRFNLPPNTSAYISLTFEHDEGDLDMRVTQGETTVGSSVGREDTEYIGIPAGAGGDYLLRVFKFTDSSQPYTVRIDQNPAFAVCSMDEDCGAGQECDLVLDQCVAEGTCRDNGDCDSDRPICDLASSMCQPCQPDQFEPNDTIEMPVQVAQVPAGAPLNLCGGPDFYEIMLAPGGTVVAQVNFLHADGDIDVRLFGPDGMTAESAVSTNDNETLEYQSEMGGKHVLEVYGFQGIYNTYTMSVEVR